MNEYPLIKRIGWDLLRKILMVLVVFVLGFVAFKFPVAREVLQMLANGIGIGPAFAMLAEHFGELWQALGIILAVIGLVIGSAVGKSIRETHAEGQPGAKPFWQFIGKFIGG